jgi:sugar O-acyltransferase (sialic acid O-acetyltransferase NeuD family)
MSVGMTSGPIVIVGAGGFGREVLDDLEFLGFVDDGPVDEELLGRRSARLLGPVADSTFVASYVIGIGNATVRQRIDVELRQRGLEPARLIHPSSSLGSDLRIGRGSVITAGVRITTNIELGDHVHLNLNCTIGHDCVIGDFVSVFPGATVSGNVTIGAGSTIGTGANVLPGVSIGEGAFVGAGAVVTKHVEAGQTVVGSPARPLLSMPRDGSG